MKPRTKPFALCVDNTDYKASLIPGKVYRVLTDPRAAKDDLVRIVDESGEDYLYHKSHFVFVDFPPAVKKKMRVWKTVPNVGRTTGACSGGDGSSLGSPQLKSASNQIILGRWCECAANTRFERD